MRSLVESQGVLEASPLQKFTAQAHPRSLVVPQLAALLNFLWAAHRLHSSALATAMDASDKLEGPRPLLLFLGDSITQDGTDAERGGWICQLQHKYNRSADFMARGLCGYNTTWVIDHVLPGLTRELAARSKAPGVSSPSLIAVWLGTNDAALLSGEEFRQHVPLDRYRDNLRVIVERLRAATPEAALLLITPGAANNEARICNAQDGKLDRSNEEAAVYARACVQEATALGVASLDMHAVFNALGERERDDCLADGLHFTAKGNAVAADALDRTIAAAFPALAAQLEHWEFPDFREFLGP